MRCGRAIYIDHREGPVQSDLARLLLADLLAAERLVGKGLLLIGVLPARFRLAHFQQQGRSGLAGRNDDRAVIGSHGHLSGIRLHGNIEDGKFVTKFRVHKVKRISVDRLNLISAVIVCRAGDGNVLTGVKTVILPVTKVVTNDAVEGVRIMDKVKL